MTDNACPTRLTIIALILAVWTLLLCPVSLAETARTLIRNAALLITMDSSVGASDLGTRLGADILIENDKIVAIGQQLPDTGAHVIDVTGMIVMPGFIDTHNHLWQSLIRGCGTDQGLFGWLNNCELPMFNPEITLTRSEAYAGVRLSTLDLINTGVTTTVE